MPIGLFDSGVGGLSVWREVTRCMPHHPTIYFADSVHCPYGPRPPAEIRRFSRGITRFLLNQGARLIVVACNTASAAALESLRAEFDVPFVGMEPAVKPAAERTQTGHIGVLATVGTVNGDLFRNTSKRYARDVHLHVQVGEGLVEQVEAGKINSLQTETLLRTYLQPMIDAGVDQIALGCTHYPFLIPLMRRIVPDGIAIINPARPVARQAERVLMLAGIEPDETCAANHRFFTSGSPDVLRAAMRALIGSDPWIEQVNWEGGTLQRG